MDTERTCRKALEIWSVSQTSIRRVRGHHVQRKSLSVVTVTLYLALLEEASTLPYGTALPSWGSVKS